MSQKPINREFYQKVRAFVISALPIVTSSLQKGEQVPYLTEEKITMEKEGSWSTTRVPQPLYFILLERHRKEIESLPEYAACMEAMQSDTTISKHVDSLVGTSSQQIRRTSWDYLSYFVTKQLSQYPRRFEFDTMTFDRMYGDLEQFFYSDTIRLQAFSPLDNFASDVDEIDLGDGLRIRRITISELEELLSQAKFSPHIPYFDIPRLRYAVELTYQTKKMLGDMTFDKIPTPDVNVNERLTKLVTALRLFRRGSVGFNIIKTIPMLDVPAVFGGTSSGLVYRRFWGPPYALNKPEEVKFRDFWQRFNKVDLGRPAPLSVAVRRFNYAYERDKLEDKLVDYMVAFEALFFKEGEVGEFRHKLSIRVARFLTQQYNQRKQIAERMSDFYDKRSAIVHGETIDVSDEFVNAVEDYLRESIKLFFERLQTLNHNEIIDHLDLD